MPNSIDPDQKPRSNTKSKYGNLIKSNPLKNQPGIVPSSLYWFVLVALFLTTCAA